MADNLAESVPIARSTPPPIDDPSQFVLIDRVPVLDEHLRTRRKDDGTVITEYVSPKQLEVIAANSTQRAENGELGLVFIGHTDKSLPEIEQPPLAGYMRNYRMGVDHADKPVILADLYIKREYSDLVSEFPRRSVELFKKTTAHGYIDGLALLKRAPERDLGLVTYAKDDEIERFECDCHNREPENMAADTTADTATPAINDAMIDEIVSRVCDSLANDDRLTDKVIMKMGELMDAKAKSAESATANPEEPEKFEGAAGTPSGSNTTPPAPVTGETTDDEKENMELSEAIVKIATLEANNEALKASQEALKAENTSLAARIEQTEKYAKEQQEQAVRSTRLGKLKELVADGYDFDPLKKLERCAKQSDEDFEETLAEIQENYARTPVGQDEIPVARVPFRPSAPRTKAEENPMDPLADEPLDTKEVEKYIRDNKLVIKTPEDGFAAVEGYIAARKAKAKK